MATNRSYTAFPLAARTATPADYQITNNECRGLLLIVNVTTGGVGPSVNPAVYTRDNEGNLVLLTSLTAITINTAIGYAYYVGPSTGGAVAGGLAQAVTVALPEALVIRMAHGNAVSLTYSVRAYLTV